MAKPRTRPRRSRSKRAKRARRTTTKPPTPVTWSPTSKLPSPSRRWAAAFAAALAALVAPASAAGDLALLAPPSHPDGRDADTAPLDIRAVTFGQQDIRLVLSVRAWRTSSDSLCLLLSRTSGFERPRRLCVDDTLRYEGKRVAATVSRSGTSLRASVLPSALGLRP